MLVSAGSKRTYFSSLSRISILRLKKGNLLISSSLINFFSLNCHLFSIKTWENIKTLI